MTATRVSWAFACWGLLFFAVGCGSSAPAASRRWGRICGRKRRRTGVGR